MEQHPRDGASVVRSREAIEEEVYAVVDVEDCPSHVQPVADAHGVDGALKTTSV